MPIVTNITWLISPHLLRNHFMAKENGSSDTASASSWSFFDKSMNTLGACQFVYHIGKASQVLTSNGSQRKQ